MRIDQVPNGWYSDLSLQGDKVSLIRDSHIEVNGEHIDLPGENVLSLTMGKYGEIIYLAGQGNQTGTCWLWISSNKKWYGISSTFGFNPCAFSDLDSLLFIVVGNNQYVTYNLNTSKFSPIISLQIGSQGIRYIRSGSIVTGDSTYGPAPYNIAQYVELQSGLAIGQSYTDGCIAVYDGLRYQIQLGECQFIRAYINGDNICFCVDIPGVVATFYWMTLDELKTFPLEVIPPDPPIPPVDPPIPPVDPPIPPEPPVNPPIPPVVKYGIEELSLMEPEIVSLVAFDHYARVDGNKVVFDQVVESDSTNFELSKPDDRYAIKKDGKFVGVDSTIFSPDIKQQYYMSDGRGNYESFFVGTVQGSGLIVAFVQYINQGANNTVPFISVPVTIKRKS